MKKLAIIGAGALFMASCSPTEYQVKREMVIDAPSSIVFEQVNNHSNRIAWSPWESKDPEMTKSYEGPESGLGAIYKWSGNEDVGTGMLEITESTPSTFIKSELAFTEPWESSSTVEWTFEEGSDGTRAVWTISGELPGFMFWMGQEEMDEAMAEDLENGLQNLKTICETQAAENSEPVDENFVAEYVEVTGQAYYFIQDETPFSGVNSEFYGERYGAMMAYLGEDSQNLTGPPFAIYHEWDEENENAIIAVSLACISEKPAADNIKKGLSYDGGAIKCVHMGPYENAGPAHKFVHQFIKDNNYEFNGSPWEVYVTDPGEEPDPNMWITEIYYPVTMAEAM